MNQKIPPPPPEGLALADIYYIIFRHKWLICGLTGAGLIAAVLVLIFSPKKYQSEAKLYISYVLENKSPRQLGADTTVQMAGAGGYNLLNNELEFLTSYDLAAEVASNVGPKEILGKTSGTDALGLATAAIRLHLQAQAPGRSDCIVVTFDYPDPAIPQVVLRQLIQCYLRKHAEIHHPLGENDDFLQKEIDQWRTSLNGIDEELHKRMTDANIVSLEDSKRDYSGEAAKLHEAIDDAAVELDEHRATISAITNILARRPSPATVLHADTNVAMTDTNLTATESTTNVAVTKMAPGGDTNNPPATNSIAVTRGIDGAVAPTKFAEYQRLRSILESQRKREDDLRIQFTGENKLVKAIEDQIAETQKLIAQMEVENPGLVAVRATQTVQTVQGSQNGQSTVVTLDPEGALRAKLQNEIVEATRTQAKIIRLASILNKVQTDSTNLLAIEGPISELQRRRSIAETNYQISSASLEQSRTEELFRPDQINRINNFEQPTPPAVKRSKAVATALGIFLGCVVAAFGLAFANELFFDLSLKHAKQIEAKLGKPVLLSIPWMNGHPKPRRFGKRKVAGLLSHADASAHMDSPQTGSTQQGAAQPGSAQPGSPQAVVPTAKTDVVPPSEPRFQEFYETLRDRLVSYFEALNLTHKPKLVALCGCHTGAGVTQIAAGLAASLSETGEGRVLLVDMTGQDGKTHHFYNGKIKCGLDEVLQNGEHDDALVRDNLYVARETSATEKLPRILPKRFSHLLPQMKASNYDYIIFDMPPISQISVTPRLARFMDMVLVVIESEKTDRDLATRALAWLSESKTNIGLVLNKKRSYVPARILPEI